MKKPNFSTVLAAVTVLLFALQFNALGQCCGAAPSSFTQPDGQVIEVHFHGNELYTRTTSADGYTLVFDTEQKAYFYARLAQGGNALVSSGRLAKQKKPADLNLPQHLEINPIARRQQVQQRKAELEAVRKDREKWHAQKKAMSELRSWRKNNAAQGKPEKSTDPVLEQDSDPSGPNYEAAPDGSSSSGGSSPAPPTNPPTLGDLVGLTILVDFPDVQARADVTRSDIDDYCNKPGGKWSNNASIQEYFHIQSNGRLNYNNNVTYYVRMPNPFSYYNDTSKGSGECGRLLLQDAINILLAEGYDFSGISVDPANGRVIATNLLWAGNDSGVWSQGLWPHRWVIGPVSIGGGKYIYDYQCTDIGTSGYPTIGTFCHENGHLVGKYPDYYDTDGGEGVGNHCLMGAGNHATQTNPTNISSYLKYHSGWMDVVELTSLTPPIRLAATVDNTIVYKYTNTNTGWTDEYFLIENRSKVGGWEAASGLPDSGLMISHAHESGGNSTSGPEDGMTQTDHYEHSIEQADGNFQLEGQGTWGSSKNRGDAYDYFHSGGTGPKTEFSDTTSPAAKWWANANGTKDSGTNSGLHIHSVSSAGPVMTFVYGTGTPSGNPNTRLTRTFIEAATDFGSNADSQTFYVYNGGGGTLSYSVTPNAGWLNCSIASGSATTEADVVTVNFTTSALSPGTHNAVITVDGGTGGVQAITVTLTVNSQPTLTVSPGSISVQGFQGAAGPSATLDLNNVGGGTANYTVSNTQSWLTVSPTSGTIGLERDTIELSFDATGLSGGIYNDTVTISSADASNSPLTIPVTFAVDSTNMILTAPDGGESWTRSVIHNITWSSDLTGNVQIELYKGGVKQYDIKTSTPNDGVFEWLIPAGQAEGNDYQVKVISLESGFPADISFANFSIVAPSNNIFVSDLETDPLLTTTGLFEWGTPGGNNAASAARSGTSMYDTDLDNTCWLQSTLTTMALDCSKHQNVTLNFWAHKYVYIDYTIKFEVSNDGTNWVELYSITGDTSQTWTQYNYTTEMAAVADGQPTVYVRWSMLGNGSQYGGAGLAIDDISITGDFVPDSPPYGVTISETGGSTDVAENGANDTYTIVLDTQPTADVTINISGDADVSVAPASVTFSTVNWDTPQQITVSAINDSLHELLHTGTITHSATSADTNYDAIAIANLVVNVVDDDNNAPTVYAGVDQTIDLTQVGGDPVAGAYFEWDASNDTAGDNVWTGTTANAYNWTFGSGSLSPANVSDSRFGSVTKAYAFPSAKSLASTAFDSYGSNQPATFEFVLDVDGTDGSIFETGGSGDGLQVDVVGGVIRGTCQESTPARVQYTLTPTDMGRFIHVVFVADSAADVVQLYIDGQLKDTAAWTGPDWSGTDKGMLGGQTGSMPTGGSTADFSGKMALFRYYRNKAFTAADVATNFDSISGTSATATLDGTVSDADSDPTTTQWTKQSGPGSVSFTDDAAVDTVASFDAEGVYVLRLTATDNIDTVFDECTITVNSPSPYGVDLVESGGSTAVAESGATSDTYSLVLSSEPTADVVITVTGDADVSVSPGTLTFTAANWNQAQTVTVTAIDDDILEGNHTGSVSHLVSSNDSNYHQFAVANLVVSVEDDDDPGTLALESTTTSVGESDGTVTLSVARSGGSKGTASVNYATANDTANGGSDYTTKNGTLTWADGEIASKTITIDITSDVSPESDETFTLTLSGVSGANLGSPTATTITIIDDDEPGALSLTAANYDVGESGGVVTLSVDRVGGTAGSVSVQYATSDGDATGGADYTATSGTLTWSAGDGSVKSFSIPILNDATAELPETFTVTLSNVSVATLGSQTSATVTISDDDFSPDTITGLVGWYDAQEINAAIGSGVTSWSDQTGGSNTAANPLTHYASATGNTTAVAPQLQQVTLNGIVFQSVRFLPNGNKEYELLQAAGLVADGDTDRTVVTVYKGGNNDIASQPFSFGSTVAGDGSNGANYWSFRTDGNGSMYFGKNGNNDRLINSQTAGLDRANVSIRTSVMNSANSYDEFIDVLDANFTDNQVLSNGNPSVDVTPTPVGSFFVGDTSTTGGVDQPTFDVLEILVFDKALSNSERTQLQDYLQVKYTSAPVSSFTISTISSPQTVGQAISGITITAKDDANNTVTSFTGTVTYGGSAGITGTSASFVDGVLSGVSLTPLNVGSGLTFTVSDGMGATGSATFTVQTAYDGWSGGTGFEGDSNGDGIKDGLAWVFGASDKNVGAGSLVPTVDHASDVSYLIYNYRLNDQVAGSGTTVNVEYGSTLGTWAGAVHDGSNVIITTYNDFYGSGVDKVEVKIKKTEAVNGKLFTRLKVLPPP